MIQMNLSTTFVRCPSIVRRLESKFDAKQLWSEAIAVRCKDPPAQRKVPIQFNSWLVVHESGRDKNIFMSSQLVLDRLGPPPHVNDKHQDSKPPIAASEIVRKIPGAGRRGKRLGGLQNLPT